MQAPKRSNGAQPATSARGLGGGAKRAKGAQLDDRAPINVLELGSGRKMTLAVKAALLQELKDLRYIPDDVACSRGSMIDARKAVAARRTPFGQLLMKRTFMTDDGPKEYPVQNPLAMLYVAMHEGDRYAAYVRDALRVHGAPSPASPWSIVVYVDEVTCGNPLAVRADARRKVQGVYWAIYHLGERALCDESCWFELVAFRTSETSTFVGSVSHLLDVCLTCFFDPNGHHLRYGALFDLKGHGSFMLSLVVEMLIADIKALVEAIGANGVSAILPCFLCRRILSFKAKEKPEMQALSQFVNIGCLDQTKWGKHTDASLLAVLSEVETATATLGPTELKRKVTLSGFKHIENNFLRNAFAIQCPLLIICLDWMHLFFQSGNWNREVFRILKTATTRTCAAYRLMHQYVDAFTFPRGWAGSITQLCDAHWESCKTAEIFKSSASGGLTLYAVLCKFFDDVLLPRFEGTALHATLTAMVVSYHRLADVVDLLQLSMHGRQVLPDLLDSKVSQWREANYNAYGNRLTYLKTHLTSHLADILRARAKKSKYAMLMACWTLDCDACICTIVYNGFGTNLPTPSCMQL